MKGGGTIAAAAGVGVYQTGDTTSWLWNKILPWAFHMDSVPSMPHGVAAFVGAGLLGAGAAFVLWIQRKADAKRKISA